MFGFFSDDVPLVQKRKCPHGWTDACDVCPQSMFGRWGYIAPEPNHKSAGLEIKEIIIDDLVDLESPEELVERRGWDG